MHAQTYIMFIPFEIHLKRNIARVKDLNSFTWDIYAKSVLFKEELVPSKIFNI